MMRRPQDAHGTIQEITVNGRHRKCNRMRTWIIMKMEVEVEATMLDRSESTGRGIVADVAER